jgi:hypothetical protein
MLRTRSHLLGCGTAQALELVHHAVTPLRANAEVRHRKTVVDTFEAIRLLLGTSQAAFVIAAHQKIVESAIDARFPDLGGDGQSMGIGAQYLEKMFQIKVAVPALAVSEVVTHVNCSWPSCTCSPMPSPGSGTTSRRSAAPTHCRAAFTFGTFGDLGLEVPR